MTLFIFHGDHHLQSRQALYRQLDKLKQQGHQHHWLIGDKLTPAQLEVSLRSQNLFLEEDLVIENLLSRPTSKDKQACLNLIDQYQGSKHIFLWEKKLISATTLKRLNNQHPQIQQFKIPLLIFKFLDLISPQTKTQSLQQLHQLSLQESPNFIFAMIVRRLGQLIIAHSNPEQLQGKPWQTQKLIRQARTWTLPQLLKFHYQLVQLDLQLKTSQTPLDLIDQLDLLLLEL